MNQETVAKSKKKIKKRWIVLGVVGIIIVGSIVSGIISGGKVTVPVPTQKASKQDLLQTVEISGTVMSEEETTYFAKVNAVIDELNVTEGGSVSNGDKLVTYDTSEIEESIEKAKLAERSTDLGADAAITSLAEGQKKVHEAAKNYDEAVKYVKHYQECVNQLNGQLTEANKIADKMATVEGEMVKIAERMKALPDDSSLVKKYTKKEKEYNKLEEQYKAYNVADIKVALETCSEDLADYKAQEAEYKATKEADDPSAGLQMEQQKVSKQAAALDTKSLTDDLAQAQAGVNAEFDGIVSQIKVTKGESVAAGTPLFTISNAKKVKVNIELTKYNLENVKAGQKATVTINGKEYTGEVSEIEKVAKNNASGTVVVGASVHLDQPDDDIYLGVEGKVVIEVAKKEQTIAIPLACVNYSTNGTFCYVLEDGKIAKKNIEIGITSDEYAEVLSGIEENAEVIDAMGQEYEEGTMAVALPEAEEVE